MLGAALHIATVVVIVLILLGLEYRIKVLRERLAKSDQQVHELRSMMFQSAAKVCGVEDCAARKTLSSLRFPKLPVDKENRVE